MKKYLKYLAGMVLALGLAACGGQAAHAATTNAMVLNPASLGGDGRFYSIANAVLIVQNDPTKFTITFPDGTTQAIADSGSAKFNGIAANYADFNFSWVSVKTPAGLNAYVNLAQFDYAACTGGNLGVGGNGHGSANYIDGPVNPTAICTSLSALAAHSN